jgi:hypothetical protein
MSRQAISVTLDSENLTWLRGRVGAGGGRSVSDLLDRLVTEARTSGRLGQSRSVVGTIDLDPSDPRLERADDAIRALFGRSIRGPIAVREDRASYGARRRLPKRDG